MSNFLYDSDEVPVYDPMEAYDLSMRGDCVPNNFTLNPSEVPSGEAMATFDLTPAGGDGMIFSLTPVSEGGAMSLTSVDQTESNSGLDSLGLGYDRLLQAEIGTVSNMSPMYTKELTNTISAMTFSPPPTTIVNTSNKINFSPPIQVSSSGSLTPDFTGLLPPPPPSPQERSNSRPPPQLLAMASPGHLDQSPDLPSYPFTGNRSIVEAYCPPISTPSPAASPLSGRSPLTSPRPLVSPGPPLYSQPRPQQSPNTPNRSLQPHQLQPNPPPLEAKHPPTACSPKSQLSQLLQQSPKIPAAAQPSSIFPSPKQAPKVSTLPSPSYPPPPSPNYPSPKQTPKISTLPSPSYPPPASPSYPPPPSPNYPSPKQAPKMSTLPSPSYPPPASPSYPPTPSSTYLSHKQPPKMSTLPSPSYPPPQVSTKPLTDFSPPSHHYSTPPPPYKSPPYTSPFYPSEQQSLLSTALQSPLNQEIHSHLNPQMSPKSTLHIAPSVTLTKKQKATTPKSPLPVKSPPPFPYSTASLPQQPLPPYPTHFASPNPSLQPSSHHQPFLKPADAATQPPITSAPPPPYSATGQPKLPSYSLEELKDLPGVNLKKSTVDLNTYVNMVVQNRHPHFANIDGFAERCLACIVRKIRSNLPTLKALEAISMCGRGSQADPGCVLIPRMKDGRITIARPGGGAGGTKKIHPHLALVQIFKNPSVVNHNTLVSSPHCAAPFIAKGEGEGEMVCISPLHYHVDSQKVKSPSTPKKKPPMTNSIPPPQLNTANTLLNHIRAMEQKKLESLPMIQQDIGQALDSGKNKEHLQEIPLAEMKITPPKKQIGASTGKRSVKDVGSDSDFLSDSEDEVDWVKKWEEERVEPGIVGEQEFNEEELIKEIEIMTIKKGELGKEEVVAAEKQLVERLKLLDGFRDLVSGKYDLDPLKALQKPKPKKSEAKNKKIPKVEKQVPTVRKKPGPKPKKKIGEAWISDPNKGKSITGEKQKHPELKTEVAGAATILASTSTQHVEEEKDEAVIQNLLEDIKGSFESQFEMDLETFGNHEEQTFSNQDFAMTNAFNLSSLDELSKDSFVGQSALASGVTSGSSDAMFGGAGAGLELPGLVASWQEKDEERQREQIHFRQDQEITYREQQELSFRGQEDLSQDMPYTTEHQGLNFRDQQELFSSREPEDLTFGHRSEPEDLTFGHRQPQDLTFGHREPEDLTFGHRQPEDLTFGHTEPEDLTFGHRGSQQLGSDQSGTEFGSSGFLSAGSISQEQFLDMFGQD